MGQVPGDEHGRRYRNDSWVHFKPGGEGWYTFVTRIPVKALVPGHRTNSTDGVPQTWNTGSNGWKTTLHVEGRKAAIYPVMAEDATDGHYRLPADLQTEAADREVFVHRNGSGYVVLFERDTLPLAKSVTWHEDGSLEVVVGYAAEDMLSAAEYATAHIVVRSRAHGAERVVPITWYGQDFSFVVTPAAMRTLAGEIPLAMRPLGLLPAPSGPLRGHPGEPVRRPHGQDDPGTDPRVPQ